MTRERWRFATCPHTILAWVAIVGSAGFARIVGGRSTGSTDLCRRTQKGQRKQRASR